jgi:hypothetical protein
LVRTLTLKKRRARAPALVFGQEGPVDFRAASSAVTSVQTIDEYYARSGRFVAGAKPLIAA